MEVENMKGQLRGNGGHDGAKATEVEVSNGRLNSENVDTKHQLPVEVPNIRLAPEQIEEIHTDEYSLTLFYATRIEPMSAADIKREFPEPEPKKAQSVMDRFVKVGLVHITEDGRYYSNYPENYINYSHYRYDNDLEARKDSKVFRLMKEFTGNKEYWKDKTYFSMDAFYSQEQTAELIEMFRQIKLKAKEYANENGKKKSTKGMKFRRMKFYDMTFTIALAFFLSCLGLLLSFPANAGGNDPHAAATLMQFSPPENPDLLRFARGGGGGNDPNLRPAFGKRISFYSPLSEVINSGTYPEEPDGGGHDPTEPKKLILDCNGGHDPKPPGITHLTECDSAAYVPQERAACAVVIDGTLIPVQPEKLCGLERLINFVAECDRHQNQACVKAERQIEILLEPTEREEGQAE